jgi:hypothetical protein
MRNLIVFLAASLFACNTFAVTGIVKIQNNSDGSVCVGATSPGDSTDLLAIKKIKPKGTALITIKDSETVDYGIVLPPLANNKCGGQFPSAIGACAESPRHALVSGGDNNLLLNCWK